MIVMVLVMVMMMMLYAFDCCVELLLYFTVLQSGAVSVKTGKVYFQGGYETPNAEGGFNLLSAIGEIPMKSKKKNYLV